MDYVGIISKLLICIFEAYIYYDFLKGVFEYRSTRQIMRISALIIMIVSIWTVNCMNSSLMNVCLVPICFFMGNCLLYKGHMKERLIYVIVFFLVLIGIELLFEISFSVVCVFIVK